MKRLLLALFFVTTPALAEQCHMAAVMRQETLKTGWHLLDTPGHTPVNIIDVAPLDNGKLLLTYSQHFAEIGTVSIQPDETYAAFGLTVGASVGLDTTLLSLYAPFVMQLTGTTVTWGNYITTDGPNQRLVVDTSRALIDGTIKVTHPTQAYPGDMGPPVIITQIGGPPQVWVSAQTRQSYVLQATPEFWASRPKVAVTRGLIRVRAQDIASTTGNLWFYGTCIVPPPPPENGSVLRR